MLKRENINDLIRSVVYKNSQGHYVNVRVVSYGNNDKVKYNANDPQEGYLEDKLSPNYFEDNGNFQAVIKDGSIGTDELADDSITVDKLKDDSVSTDKIQDSSITVDKLASDIDTTQIGFNADKVDGRDVDDTKDDDTVLWTAHKIKEELDNIDLSDYEKFGNLEWNKQVLDEDYTYPDGVNGLLFGPTVSIAVGTTITIQGTSVVTVSQ